MAITGRIPLRESAAVPLLGGDLAVLGSAGQVILEIPVNLRVPLRECGVTWVPPPWAGRAVSDAVPVVRGLEPFDRFLAREFPKMVSIAYALSAGRRAAEDLAQEAMIAAYRRWPEIGQLERPGGWARRVVLNLAASAYERRKAEARALLRLAPLRGEPPAELSAEAGEFWQAVRRLPKRQAQTVALFYLGEASVAEIAEVLDCAESTVKVHLHRARQALAKRLRVEES